MTVTISYYQYSYLMANAIGLMQGFGSNNGGGSSGYQDVSSQINTNQASYITVTVENCNAILLSILIHDFSSNMGGYTSATLPLYRNDSYSQFHFQLGTNITISKLRFTGTQIQLTLNHTSAIDEM